MEREGSVCAKARRQGDLNALANRGFETLPFATTWMDREIITLREISQTGKVENHMLSLTREL